MSPSQGIDPSQVIDAIVQSTVDEVQLFASRRNAQVLANYEMQYLQWEHSVPLFLAAKMDVPPQPTAPDIEIVDAEKVKQLFIAYSQAVGSNSANGLPTPGGFDPSPAITFKKYVRPVAPKPVPVGQPDNPLGAPMDDDGINFAPAPGDVRPNNDTYTNDEGLTYRKTIRAGYGGVKLKKWTLVQDPAVAA